MMRHSRMHSSPLIRRVLIILKRSWENVCGIADSALKGDGLRRGLTRPSALTLHNLREHSLRRAAGKTMREFPANSRVSSGRGAWKKWSPSPGAWKIVCGFRGLWTCPPRLPSPTTSEIDLKTGEIESMIDNREARHARRDKLIERGLSSGPRHEILINNQTRILTFYDYATRRSEQLTWPRLSQRF